MKMRALVLSAVVAGAAFVGTLGGASAEHRWGGGYHGYGQRSHGYSQGYRPLPPPWAFRSERAARHHYRKMREFAHRGIVPPQYGRPYYGPRFRGDYYAW